MKFTIDVTHQNEEEYVRNLCEALGYGRVMHLVSYLWNESDATPGSHFVVGPGQMMTKPCPHKHLVGCLWCGGCGWVTEAVHDLIVAATTEPPADDITVCPGCGGEADNGFDRCIPPSPYYCSKCHPPEPEPEPETKEKCPGCGGKAVVTPRQVFYCHTCAAAGA